MNPLLFGRIRVVTRAEAPPFDRFGGEPSLVTTVVAMPLPDLELGPPPFMLERPIAPAPMLARPPRRWPRSRPAGRSVMLRGERPLDPRPRPTAESAASADRAASTPESAPAPAVGATPSPATARRAVAIPHMFQPPWEFDFTREEALLAMETEALRGGGGALDALARRVRELGGTREQQRAHERWRERLRERTLDEQLFGVRPPARAYADPAIRAWARRLLETAGYEVEPMLREWEIFWRRKSV